MSKLGETINSRFRIATSSAGGAAAPASSSSSGGVSVNATGDDAEDAPDGARAFSPTRLTNLLVEGIRDGIGKQTSATPHSPSSPSPPLSERAVKGVLGSVFTTKDATKGGGGGGEGGDGGGGGVQATAAEGAGGPAGGGGPVGASATTASDGNNNRSGGFLGRFGRSSQGSGRSKSPPPLKTTPDPADEPRQDNNNGGRRGSIISDGDKTNRDLRGGTAKKKVDTKRGVPAGVAAKSSTHVATAAAPSARSKADKRLRPATAAGSATNAPGKAKKQQGDDDDALRATEKKAVRPDNKRRRRSRGGTEEEERRWSDVDVAAEPSTDGGNLMDKVRVPWANLKIDGRGARGEQGSRGGEVDADGADSNGGNNAAVVTRMRSLFGGRREGRGGGSVSNGNTPDPLDEIGLGA